jgi:hypothetical protein
MTKVFIFFLGLFLVACSAPQTANYNAPKVVFSAEFSNEKYNNAYDPIIAKYQEILKGMLAKDTSYLFNATRELIQLTDSLSQIRLGKDTISQERFSKGLMNVNAELRGLLASASIDEVPMSVHMSSIQLLYALGEIGYNGKTIYIYTVDDDDVADGLLWLSALKNMRDPYHPEQKASLTADQVLQEMK